MPQPKTKPQIIKRLQAERRRLEANLEKLMPEQMVQAGVVGEWSVKDVLAHLAEWESSMSHWITASRRGETVEAPNWKEMPDLNQRIYQNHKDRSLNEVLVYFHETHRQFMEMVEAMPEDEMLTPGRYTFFGGGVIWDWLNGYAAHDLWGKTQIIKWVKEIQQNA